MSDRAVIRWVAHPSRVEPDRITVTTPDGRELVSPMPMPSNYMSTILRRGEMAWLADPIVLPRDGGVE